ncbi:neutral zinc metallopeptidase [uncultured Helcococcus sp.]|uniref:KPN_02809 family neutral zinc metallopeptidase n=1 Tax=uncultured Helcococcus sp. TaxID=1072508 RepID=UPI00288BC484|nr:neutral zinc metallopeptidase [uncultured Helcococcus sp.]
MKWKGRRESDNVRKSSGGQGGPVGLGGLVGGLGGTGIVILLAVSLLFNINPFQLIGSGIGVDQGRSSQNVEEYVPRSEEEAEIEKFLSVVLADTEDVWGEIFAEHGSKYVEPTLVLYQNQVKSRCGLASNRMGPFYCSADQSIYIDVEFAKQLRTTFGAKGDFPFAYVLAHEVGHHVQLQTGALNKVHSLRGRVSDKEFNRQMVNLELQADYYAGVFAHYVGSKGYLDPGDVEEGLAAASGVGDDRIQEMSGRRANPDTFQHGTSKQRSEWFMRGYKYGDLEHGNTFELVNN